MDIIQMAGPEWLPLLRKPYDNIFGPKSIWDLRMADGTAVRIERGSQGLNNALYRVRIGGNVYACKFFIADERQRGHREWAALCTLRAARLKLAPEPVAFAPAGPLPQPAIIYRWISGEPLDAKSVTDSDLVTLIANWQQVHRVPYVPRAEILKAWHQPPDYATYLAEIQASAGQICDWTRSNDIKSRDLPTWVTDLPSLVPLIVKTACMAESIVARASDQDSYPFETLVRVDGNLDNVLRDTEGQLVFVDWEYSGWGDPAYDLAELRWHPRGQPIPQARWEAALATYTPRPDDPTFAERLSVYSRLLPIWWVGRSALHLLEGAKQIIGRSRLVPIPTRMYRAARVQLDNYLAALGLVEPPEPPERPDEDE